MQDFKTKVAEMKGSELQKEVAGMLEVVKQNRLMNSKKRAGEYLPLSVYQARGYDAETLANLEKEAPKLWDETLKCYTYQLSVVSESAEVIEELKRLIGTTTHNMASMGTYL